MCPNESLSVTRHMPIIRLPWRYLLDCTADTYIYTLVLDKAILSWNAVDTVHDLVNVNTIGQAL